MFLSVTEGLILVTRWQHVSTHMEVLDVCVTLGSLEMDLHAQVIFSNLHSVYYFQCANMNVKKACKILSHDLM